MGNKPYKPRIRINDIIKYFQVYEEKKDYRQAFISAFINETVNKKKSTDDEIYELMKVLAESEVTINETFNRLENQDIFERFYLSCKELERKYAKTISTALQPFIESMNKLNKDSNLRFESARRMVEGITQQQQKLAESVRKAFKPVVEAFSNINKDWFKSLDKQQKELATKMVSKGWYYTSNLPAFLGNEFEDESNLDNLLEDFYGAEFEEMLNRIKSLFPNRTHIFKKIEKAYNEEDFELAIPAMLTQADGISFEIFDESFLSKDKGVPKLKNQKEITFDWTNFLDIMYAIQIETVGSINKNTNKLKHQEFNRHNVMHGHDFEYGTRVNALKCLAILYFLADIKEFYILQSQAVDI